MAFPGLPAPGLAPILLSHSFIIHPALIYSLLLTSELQVPSLGKRLEFNNVVSFPLYLFLWLFFY